MLKNATFQEAADRLEVHAPWLGRGKRIALSVVFLAGLAAWLWSEAGRVVEYPGVVLIPLPLFSCIGYLIAVLVLGSTRILIDRDGVALRYEGLPSLPNRRISRDQIVRLCYWEQVVPSRNGSYTTGVAGVECMDGTRPALVDTLEGKADAQRIAKCIAEWWKAHPRSASDRPIEIREAFGRPKKLDMAVMWRVLGVIGSVGALLVLTAILSEYYGI